MKQEIDINILKYFYRELQNVQGCICGTLFYDEQDIEDKCNSLSLCMECRRNRLQEIIRQMNVAIQMEDDK